MQVTPEQEGIQVDEASALAASPTSSTLTNSAHAHSEPLTTNKWLVAAAVIVPTILEVVDGTVVSVIMPNIQGSLNASVDEVTWVLTSYLVANGIVIPHPK